MGSSPIRLVVLPDVAGVGVPSFSFCTFGAQSSSMDDTVCYEYLFGFCTRTEFFVENITEKCGLRHADTRLPAESLKAMAAGVLEKYVSISREVDRRIANNTYLLSMKSDVYSTMDAIDRLQQEIISAGESENISQMKVLLKIHGLVVDAARSTGSKELPYSVCGTCSFFCTNGGKCEHPLHDKYRQLRKAIEKLQGILSS